MNTLISFDSRWTVVATFLFKLMLLFVDYMCNNKEGCIIFVLYITSIKLLYMM